MTTPYYQPYWLEDDSLEHFGIKGMKWGVRRYQNYDGTLTKLGKQRYAPDYSEAKRAARRKKTTNSSRAKKIAKVGVVAASSVLAAYGAYKLYDISVPKTIEVTRTVSKQVPYQAVTHYRPGRDASGRTINWPVWETLYRTVEETVTETVPNPRRFIK